MTEEMMITHTGSCHCGAIRFTCKTQTGNITAIDCDCSICKIKANLHFMVDQQNFTLLEGADQLTCYTFNTHQAKHLFCKQCGVQSFYRPRSHPESYGVNPRCITSETISKLTIIEFNGQKWEENVESLYEKKLDG